MAFVLIMVACVTSGLLPGGGLTASPVVTRPLDRGGPHATCPIGLAVPLGIPDDGRGLRNNARASLMEGNEDEAEEPRTESIGFLPNEFGAPAPETPPFGRGVYPPGRPASSAHQSSAVDPERFVLSTARVTSPGPERIVRDALALERPAPSPCDSPSRGSSATGTSQRTRRIEPATLWRSPTVRSSWRPRRFDRSMPSDHVDLSLPRASCRGKIE